METRSAKRRPTHPGALLRDLVIPESGVGIGQFAECLGISRQNLSAILHEERAITPDMALRLSKFLGNRPEFWLNLQNAYDIYQIERQNPEIDRIRPLWAVAA